MKRIRHKIIFVSELPGFACAYCGKRLEKLIQELKDNNIKDNNIKAFYLTDIENINNLETCLTEDEFIIKDIIQ